MNDEPPTTIELPDRLRELVTAALAVALLSPDCTRGCATGEPTVTTGVTR